LVDSIPVVISPAKPRNSIAIAPTLVAVAPPPISTELVGKPETVEAPGVVNREKGMVSSTGFAGFTTWFIVISTCENLFPSGNAGS
jgi:hypothetical protein